MSVKIRIGLLQYPLVPDFQKNLDLVFYLLKKIARKKPRLIVLPEMWLGAPRLPSERKEWFLFYQLALTQVRKWCRDHHIACYFSQLEKSESRFYNTAYFIEPDGSLAGRYRKIHLFSFGGETKIYSAGKNAKPFKMKMGKVGGVICYDIRFPELIRHLAIQGVTLLLVCAQWPKVRREHWLTLLRARAIENQIFVVGVNRLGKKGKTGFGGDSVVFGPWGETLLHLDSKKQMGICEINISDVQKIRKQYPFFYERRFS